MNRSVKMKVSGFLAFIVVGLSAPLTVDSVAVNKFASNLAYFVKHNINAIKDAPNLDVPNFFSLKFPTPKVLQSEYDFIVVGSGPAGSVVASRLSEDGKYSVLLLEAGSTESPFTSDMPISSPNLQSTNFDWGYRTTTQDRACLGMTNQQCHWPKGKVLGGSSILYYMIYTRGNRRDFDNWARAGNPGWSWNDVLPYFIKSENSSLHVSSALHGYEGPLPVEDIPYRTPICRAYVRSAQEAGHAFVDYNSGDQLGVSYMQQSTRKGRRISAARAYLYPVRFRKNLHISTHSFVKKVILDQDPNTGRLIAKGVQLRRVKDKTDLIVRARREVILSAGAFESAKLLMLSGVGPASHLAQMNIPLVKHLPVGQTLFEHMGVFGPVFIVNKPIDNLINLERILTIKHFTDYIYGRGPMTMNGIEAILYMKTNISDHPDPGFPDIEIMQAFSSLSFDTGGGTPQGIDLRQDIFESMFRPIQNRRTFMFAPMLLHPKSVGYMALRSNNPYDHPIFEPNFFDDYRDRETLVAGMKEGIRIASQPSFQRLGLELYTPVIPTCPYVQPGSDDYWRCWASTIAATFHHQVGTCKMGPESDPTTVVDHTLMVHGFDNLRVVDIGIIPQPPSGHTNAYSFMIGEKASDMIKERWNSKYGSHFSDLSQQNLLYNTNEALQYYLSYQPEHRFGPQRHRFKRSHFDWQLPNPDEEIVTEPHKQKPKVEKKAEKVILVNIAEPEDQVLSNEQPVIQNTTPQPEPSDLKQILMPSVDDISRKFPTSEPTVMPLSSTSKESGLKEILDSIPSIDEDEIRTVDLDEVDGFNHGKNKPKLITEILANINTTHFEKEDFPVDNETKAIHLPILHDTHSNIEDQNNKETTPITISTEKSVRISRSKKVNRSVIVH